MTTLNYPSNTASSALPVGTGLGEFQITGVIGEGGFGIVYSAHDSSLDRIVAIKEYLPSAFAQRTHEGLVQVKSEDHRKTFAAGLSSFINEAKMLAKFSHPGLVEVFRFWEANGTAYMAMRYYRGVTLREMLRTTPQIVSEQWLCETLDPILLALKELHNERCYHRDIAPDNILVLPNGRSVLMDFGAARRIISGMTQALTTVLKPGYAPIEQYYDDGSMSQGAWTDIYAVGGLLYHVITGKVPVQAISRMISDPLKPVSELARGSYSPRLFNVVMRCLAVLPANRYQNVDELRAALGWVTTPVISTVVHSAQPAETVVDDYPATVILQTSHVARDFLNGVKDPVQVPPERVNAPASARVGESDPEATVIKPPSRVPVAAKMVGELPVRSSAGAGLVEPVPVKAAVIADRAQRSKILPFVGIAVAVTLVLGASVYFYKSGSNQAETVAVSDPVPVRAVPEVAPTVIEHAPGPVVVPAPAMETPSTTVFQTPVSSDSGQGASTNVPPPAVAVSTPVSRPPAATMAGSNTAPTTTTGLVRFELKDGWGTVFVDGEQKGTAPPVLTVRLSAGDHEVELRNPALPTVKRSVTVIPGKTVMVRHVFTK